MKKSKFRDWLYQNNLMITEFADLISCHRGTVWRWMVGDKMPDIRSMRKVRALTKNEIFDPEDLVDKKGASCVKAPKKRSSAKTAKERIRS